MDNKIMDNKIMDNKIIVDQYWLDDIERKILSIMTEEQRNSLFDACGKMTNEGYLTLVELGRQAIRKKNIND